MTTTPKEQAEHERAVRLAEYIRTHVLDDAGNDYNLAMYRLAYLLAKTEVTGKVSSAFSEGNPAYASLTRHGESK